MWTQEEARRELLEAADALLVEIRSESLAALRLQRALQVYVEVFDIKAVQLNLGG